MDRQLVRAVPTPATSGRRPIIAPMNRDRARFVGLSALALNTGRVTLAVLLLTLAQIPYRHESAVAAEPQTIRVEQHWGAYAGGTILPQDLAVRKSPRDAIRPAWLDE